MFTAPAIALASMSGVIVLDTVTAPISADGMSSSFTCRPSGSGAGAVWPLSDTFSRFGETPRTVR